MKPIKVLPPGLQNQIAAGEVVERPASVVKELMENSLDAGADSVQVFLESGGQTLIEVIDTGHGMPFEDMTLALTRHATSKISSMDDLAGISSFGFRGEALPSIASVSRMTVSSCPRGQDSGNFIHLVYGEPAEQGPVSMNPGTRIRVEQLLANVPARLKFMKTKATESKKCVESFIRLALAHPETDFELFSESRSLYRFYPGQNLAARLETVWPPTICEHLRDFSLQDADIGIQGLTSSPESVQPRGDRIWLYVNNRPVSDRMLLSAVKKAYQGRVQSREFPQAVVFISVPAHMVDVNVHPAKTQVRFSNEQELFSLTVRALRSCLDRNIYPVSGSFDNKTADPDSQSLTYAFQQQSREEYSRFRAAKEQEATVARLREKKSGFKDLWPEPRTRGRSEPEKDIEIRKPSRNLASSSLEYLGQIHDSYLLFRDPQGSLLIVDQHAAHERIMLETFRQGFNKTVVKNLMLPEKITLHPAEQEIIQHIWGKLRNMGFRLQRQQEAALLISGIPDFMSLPEAVEALKDILSGRKPDLEQIFITMACNTSIKAVTRLPSDNAL